MKYAITAATGKFGQAAVTHLLKTVPHEEIVLIARDLDKAKKIFGNVEVREASYDNVDQMITALEGIERVLFISSQPGGRVERVDQHLNMVKALSASNVKFVVYTSFPKAETSSSFLASDHKATENAIKAAGIPHAFLRNNWYIENEIGFLSSGVANHIAAYWADNHAGWALEREYAEGAIKVLTQIENKEVYEFSGPAKNFNDLGEALKVAINQNVKIVKMPASDYTAQLEKTGLDHDTAVLFTSFQKPIDDGSLETSSTDLVDVLGHNLKRVPDAIQEILEK